MIWQTLHLAFRAREGNNAPYRSLMPATAIWRVRKQK